MTSEKNKIEALMFTVAKRIHIDEIAKITGLRNIDKIKTALQELRTEYEAKGSSMILQDEGEGFWKLTVKDHYMPMVQKIVTKTELDRPLMETLAVIAWKYPVLQADVVKIRHNKAYEHLKQLEELGFVTRIKFGRTNKLTLTSKFFEYFDLPSQEQAKELFKDVMPDKVKEKIERTEVEIDEAERKLDAAKRKKKEAEKNKKESSRELKKDLQKIQVGEDKELKEIEKDVEKIEKEEKKKLILNKMLLLRCPKCKHQMKYQLMKGNLIGKSKRCVYCGRSFQVKDNIVKRI